MAGTDSDRGQIVAVEVLLLLGILVVALGMYQAFGVPDQNRNTEFEHNLDVQSDLIDYRNSLLDVRSSPQIDRWHRSVQVRLGTAYPSRIVAINPPDPSGTIFTSDYGDISIDYAEVDGWFHGDPQANLIDTSHDTNLLTYQPNYNEYQTAPRTIFEHSLLYNVFDTGQGAVSNQRLIDGDEQSMNIILFDEELSHSGQRITLDPKTLDGPTAEVPLVPTGDYIELTIPSVTPAIWEDRIGETFTTGEANARVMDVGTNQVTIELQGEWDLQMSRVGYDGGQIQTVFSNIKPYAPGEIPLLSFVDESEGTTGDDLYFDVENEALESTTVKAVGVETDLAPRFNRPGGEAEISITGGQQTGFIDTGGGVGQALATDGTLYELDVWAIIDEEETATVDIGDFEGGGFAGFQDVAKVDDPEQADITVTFLVRGADRSEDEELEFYFEVDPEEVVDEPVLNHVDEDTDGDDLLFSLVNDGGASATVTGVGVETDLADVYYREGDFEEIWIEGVDVTTGYLDVPDGTKLDADGTIYSLDSSAIISPDAVAYFEIGAFWEETPQPGQPDIPVEWEHLEATTDPDLADVTVTLEVTELDDPVTLYFMIDPEEDVEVGNVQTNGNDLIFDLENLGPEITVTGVGAWTDDADRFNRPNSRNEVSILGGTQDGWLNTGGNSPANAIATDGTIRTLDQAATLDTNDIATVDIGDFRDDPNWDGITVASDPQNPDLTVYLQTSQHGVIELHFDTIP